MHGKLNDMVDELRATILKVDGDRIIQAGYVTDGCATSIASASMAIISSMPSEACPKRTNAAPFRRRTCFGPLTIAASTLVFRVTLP